MTCNVWLDLLQTNLYLLRAALHVFFAEKAILSPDDVQVLLIIINVINSHTLDYHSNNFSNMPTSNSRLLRRVCSNLSTNTRHAAL